MKSESGFSFAMASQPFWVWQFAVSEEREQNDYISQSGQKTLIEIEQLKGLAANSA